jgi:hypothetical protein
MRGDVPRILAEGARAPLKAHVSRPFARRRVLVLAT